MKLFKIENRIEGRFPSGAILIVGKSKYSSGDMDGWFIRLETPWTYISTYWDIKDFNEKTGPCRTVRAWLFRSNRPCIKVVAKVPV